MTGPRPQKRISRLWLILRWLRWTWLKTLQPKTAQGMRTAWPESESRK
uniref:Uncharacterized protein n=1 Tax=Aegilops tauschii subsp. strangulata TaxID=200361 RepID=A0A453NQH3_AEGTS